MTGSATQHPQTHAMVGKKLLLQTSSVSMTTEQSPLEMKTVWNCWKLQIRLVHSIWPVPTVPRAPEIDVSSYVIRDNSITVAWRPACEADGDGVSGRIEFYELEYRKTNHDSSLRAAGETCWEKIPDIRETKITISGEGSGVRWGLRSQVRGQGDYLNCDVVFLCFCFRAEIWLSVRRCSCSSEKQSSRWRVLWTRRHRNQRWTHEWDDKNVRSPRFRARAI